MHITAAIDKKSLSIARVYLDNILSLVFNRTALLTNTKYRDIYFNMAVNMLNMTFTDNSYTSEKWIYLLFSVLRTTFEINKSNKNNNKSITRINLNKLMFNYITDHKSDNNCLKKILEEYIRRNMKSIYKSIDIIDNLFNFKNLEETLEFANNNKGFNIKNY